MVPRRMVDLRPQLANLKVRRTGAASTHDPHGSPSSAARDAQG
jgi:hypothetical protein